jgi:hypothetical protein
MGIITFSSNHNNEAGLYANTNTRLVTFNNNTIWDWVQISPTMYAINFNGMYSTSWKVYQFKDASNVTLYNIPSNTISSSKLPTEQEVLAAIKTDTGKTFTYTGTLLTFDQSKNKINSQMEDLFKMQGTYAQSIESNYQSTMMMGLVVAMFGTTVLFYTFRQL